MRIGYHARALGILDPIPPPYDPLEWAAKPFPQKSRMVCEAWALQGYGTPQATYLVYLLKVALYIAGWVGFCSLSPTLGGFADITHWWLSPLAFQKAIIWSLVFEVLGFGCGSGPLTGRYFPPLGGALYFLRPGTLKLPLFPGTRLIGQSKRGFLDIFVYLASVTSLLVALCQPSLSFRWFIAPIVLLALAGILDKTVFLAARAEHYWVTLLCFAFAGNWIAGAKAVQLALWFWAGASKLNHHFPTVVCVMTSNGPLTRFPWLRRAMYRSYPDDLRPSKLATVMGHVGTAFEFAVPIVLVFGNGGTVTLVGLVLMVMLHSYITSHVPMGVPIEWNFMVVYAGFFLFGAHATTSLTAIGSIPLTVVLLSTLIALPLLGNLVPRAVSFLLAMRYYAGNWPYSVWLFRGESYKKLQQHLTMPSPWLYEQLDRFYDRKVSIGLVGKVIAFRLMHLHGRVMQRVLPELVDEPRNYEWVDGELIAGLTIGWNFGDGHLHSEQLLRAIQAECQFEPGELRCAFVESQPLFGNSLEYRLHDAHEGLISQGSCSVDELRALQPWKT